MPAAGGGLDLGGIAEVIGASGLFISGLIGAGLQIATFWRQGRVEQAMGQLHDSVNGQTAEVKRLIASGAFAKGALAAQAAAGLPAEAIPVPPAPPKGLD